MNIVATLPTRLTIEDAWNDYTRLVRQMDDDPTLRTNLEHQVAIVRAHERWSRLFLASDRQAC